MSFLGLPAHYAPHLGVQFEGYYSKFRLPSQSSVLLIVSAVPAAAKAAQRSSDASDIASSRKAFLITFIYSSPDSTTHWKREYYPEDFKIDQLHDQTRSIGPSEPKHGFKTTWDQGEFSWRSGSEDGSVKDTVFWRLNTKEVDFTATTTGKGIPWRPEDADSTPGGIFARFPLPIQWHVHTVQTPCSFDLDIKSEEPGAQLRQGDDRGEAWVHAEKNWAQSFPTGYTWIQGRDPIKKTGICVAGGQALPGVQAYLLGYQGVKTPFISFKPPSSVSVLGISFGLASDISFDKKTVVVDVKGWFRRLRVVANCDDADTYFDLAAPLATGHAPGYCTQTFDATVKVQVYERSWPWSAWTVVETETFERSSLEFGGDFYKQEHEE
jgi:hypothetical protein